MKYIKTKTDIIKENSLLVNNNINFGTPLNPIATEDIIDMFHLENGGEAENGYTISKNSGLVNIKQAEEICKYLMTKIKYHEFTQLDLNKILKFWKQLDEIFGKQIGKFSIGKFNENRFQQIFGFEMSINNNKFVININNNHVDSPFVRKRHSNASWEFIEFDKFLDSMTVK